jgi:hypothetical protein
MRTIKAHVRLEGGHLINNANAPHIVAFKKTPTDRQGNRLGILSNEPYLQTWFIKREPQGYIFREVNHNGGICGHHKTVRSLVLAALLIEDISIEVDENAIRQVRRIAA